MTRKGHWGGPVCETGTLDDRGSKELEAVLKEIRELDDAAASCFRKAQAFAQLAEAHLAGVRGLVVKLGALIDRRDPKRRRRGTAQDRRRP